MPIEPEPRRITTGRDLPSQQQYPLLPPELADLAVLVSMGELTPLDPLADPVRVPRTGIRTIPVEKNTGIKTARIPGIATVRPDTSGIRTVKPIRTVGAE